jgi:hypothetical protein
VEWSIGGYPALEKRTGRGRGLAWRAGATAFQSARAAMAATLRQRGPGTVWLPHHVCGAVDDAVAAAGVPVRRYVLADDLGPPESLELAAGDCLVCVDYFGFSGAGVERTLARYGSSQVLVDASLALFRDPDQAGATVYSARKFVGVPDGGWLVAPGPAPPVLAADEAASRKRCRHLLLRRAGKAEAGYPYFLESEESLGDCSPRAMSALTTRLLDRIDFDAVAERRVRNHAALARALATFGLRTLPLPASAVPLYCLLVEVDALRLREALLARRIYTPRYWPDAVPPAEDTVATALRDRTLYLPCDQRYDEDDMLRLASAVATARRSLIAAIRI